MSGVAARSADKEKKTMNRTWKYKIDMKNICRCGKVSGNPNPGGIEELCCRA